MNKISVLIPVYNEKNTLLEILRQVESVDFELEKEIILIDDYSTDGTKELYKNLPYKIICHAKNMGKGAALRDGFGAASGDIIIIQDADLEYNPSDYKPLVELIKSGKADVDDHHSCGASGINTALLVAKSLNLKPEILALINS
mgnify:CR=1 FL=1